MRAYVTCLLLMSFTSLSAQLNALKKVKDAVKKEESSAAKPDKPSSPAAEKVSTKPESVKPSPSRTSRDADMTKVKDNSQKSKGPAGQKQQVADMSTSSLSPSIAWYSLLSDGCLNYNATNGYFNPDGFYAFFLPEKDTEGQPMQYGKYQSSIAPYIKMSVRDKKKNEIKGTFYYLAEPEVLPAYKLKLSDRNTPEYPYSINLFEGEYDLEFYVSDNHFYTFPIKIEKQTNSDPYNPVKQMYWMRGEWEEWARIGFNGSNEFQLGMYLPDRNIKVESQSRWDEDTQYPYMTKLYKNGKLFGLWDLADGKTQIKGNATANNGKWYRNETIFYAWPPKDKADNNSYITYVLEKDAMTDGSYTIETEVYRPTGVEKAKYAFEIKGGVIQSHDRTNRDKVMDKKTLVEQGPNLWYLKKM
jgi:hypothetical protein